MAVVALAVKATVQLSVIEGPATGAFLAACLAKAAVAGADAFLSRPLIFLQAALADGLALNFLSEGGLDVTAHV